MKAIFYIRIAELRKSKELSQQEFAKEMHVARSTVSSWDLQVHTPPLDMLLDIARYFDVSLDYLIGNHDELGNLLTEEEIEKIIENDKKNK